MMPHSLPIDTIKHAFQTALLANHIVVEAETGSGKSTRLPLWAAKSGRVLVVEPRRVACTSLAGYLVTQEANPDQISVGYAIRFEQHFDETTQIVFATPGVALRWLSEDQLAQFATVIVDEFHERRWDTDLLLALLKQGQRHRLVVTSATIDSQRIVTYLSAKHLKAQGRQFQVEVMHYASDTRSMPDTRDLEKTIVKLVDQHLSSHQDILVFLPGRKEITQTQQALRRHFKQDLELGMLDIVPLHASVTDDERQRALTETEQQRIILATNVAETSLTIPGVTLIIDSGLERRTHQRNGRTVLSLHAISQASAEQRKGRAGRIRNGECIRMYGKTAPLERITPPELQREELVEPFLAALCSGEKFTALDFLDPLPEKTLTSAYQKLIAMNAVTEDEVVTEYGRCLYQLPIDTLFAHLITAMPDRSCREAMVDLAAALSVPQRLWQIPKSEQDQQQLYSWLGNQFCDATALIKIVRAETLPEWLQVDSNMQAEAKLLARQMRQVLSLPELEVHSSFKRDVWQKAVMGTTPELVYIRRKKRRQAMGNGNNEVTLSRETLFGISDQRAQDNEAAIVFDQFALSGRGVKQNIVLATCLSPVTLSQMVSCELGTEQQGATVETADGYYQTAVERVYAGKVIDIQWQQAQGESARTAMIELIKSGEVMEGLFQRIALDIQQWNLYLALGRYQQEMCNRYPDVVDSEAWLTEQIDGLGIEHIDDLALFSADDFVFDGIPDWQRVDFDTEFPHQVVLVDLVLLIEYQIARKTVIAHHLTGNRKAIPKRWELPRWAGWQVKYKKASRVVDVR